MNKIKLYISESYNELINKVSWPTWQELQSSAVVVLMASLLIAMLIFVMDFFSSGAVKLLYDMFK